MSRLFFAAVALIGLTLGATGAVSAAPVVHAVGIHSHAVTHVGWVYDHHHHRHWVGRHR